MNFGSVDGEVYNFFIFIIITVIISIILLTLTDEIMLNETLSDSHAECLLQRNHCSITTGRVSHCH